jgi:lipopolysaccharide transport system permease protein
MKQPIEWHEKMPTKSPERLIHSQPIESAKGTNLVVTEILPSGGWRSINFRELWQFRELIYHLAWRDIKVRYKQTVLGAAWAILQPALMMVVFTIFFSRLGRLSSGDLPYPLFVLAGILPWNFFATSISQCGNSIVNSEHLITKIYFPRLSVPLASVAAGAADFFIALSLLVGLMVYYRDRIIFGPGIFLVPFVVLLIFLAALGVGTLFAALNVAYRDFRLIVPFAVQLWLFATPSVYMNMAEAFSNQALVISSARQSPGTEASIPPANSQLSNSEETQEGKKSLPSFVKILMGLNPMTGLIATFRAATLGSSIPWNQFGLSAVWVLFLFLAGNLYFRRMEDTFPDII